MAGTAVDFALQVDDAKAQRAMRELRGSMTDLTPFLQDVGEYLDLVNRFRFDLAVGPDGTPWEGLDPAYARRKKTRKDEILVLEAHLRDQMRYQISGDELLFGSNLVYAATHQFGAPDRGIPARPYLGLSADDEGEIVRLALEHVQDAA